MMSAYMDLIFLLFLVGLIFWRLYRILGTRPEDDRPHFVVINQSDLDPQKVQEILKTQIPTMNMTPAEQVLAAVPNFSKPEFLRRCAKAFEMVIKAVAEADETTLQMLTTKKLFTKFQEVFRARKSEGITAETDLIRIKDLSVENAVITAKGLVRIVVKIVSEQINLLRSADGAIIEGDENFIQEITDCWTFERDSDSKSPAWLLASTKK
jgi:predicted lipid-binding transport protein (Tim44 family)